MKTVTHQDDTPRQGLVQDLRKIRDEVSSEINNMTFEQERDYFDKLLAVPRQSSAGQETTIIKSE